MATTETSEYVETTINVGGTDVVALRGGSGKPLLMLHDELGFPGWMRWNRELAANRELIIPLQPGFGRTPRVEWCADYRDLAAFYARMIRESGLAPIDILGFSAGGYIAAEIAAASPELIDHLVLVAPLGVRPSSGEIYDFLAVTMRTHVALTVTDHEAEEFAVIYGGDLSAQQFELFELARAETSRLGWEPFMYSPTLPNRLEGSSDVNTLIVWGEEDLIVPRGCVDVYAAALPNARIETIPNSGHRPEIEAIESFVGFVSDFLGS